MFAGQGLSRLTDLRRAGFVARVRVQPEGPAAVVKVGWNAVSVERWQVIRLEVGGGLRSGYELDAAAHSVVDVAATDMADEQRSRVSACV